jgi:hypothetical protein
VIDRVNCTDFLKTFLNLFIISKCRLRATTKAVYLGICELLKTHIQHTSASDTPVEDRVAHSHPTDSITFEATPYFKLTNTLTRARNNQNAHKMDLLTSAKQLFDRNDLDAGQELLLNVLSNRIPSMEEMVNTQIAEWKAAKNIVVPGLRTTPEAETRCIVRLWCILKYYTDILQQTPSDRVSELQANELRRIRAKITTEMNLRSPTLHTSTNRKQDRANKEGVTDGRSMKERVVDGLKGMAEGIARQGVMQMGSAFQPSGFVSSVLTNLLVSDASKWLTNKLDEHRDNTDHRSQNRAPESLDVTKTTDDLWNLIQLSFVYVKPGVGDPDVDPESLVFYYTVDNRGMVIPAPGDEEAADSATRTNNGPPEFDAESLRLAMDVVFLRKDYKTDGACVKVVTSARKWYRPFVAKFLLAFGSFPLERVPEEKRLLFLRRMWRVSKGIGCEKQYIAMLRSFHIGEAANDVRSSSRSSELQQPLFPYAQLEQVFTRELQALQREQASQTVLRMDIVMRMQDLDRKVKWYKERKDACAELDRYLRADNVHNETIEQRIEQVLRTTPPETLEDVIKRLCHPSMLDRTRSQNERRRNAYFLLEFLIDMHRKANSSSRSRSRSTDTASSGHVPQTDLYKNSVILLRKAISTSDLIGSRSPNHTTVTQTLYDLRHKPSANTLMSALHKIGTSAIEASHGAKHTGESALDSVLRLCGMRSSDEDTPEEAIVHDLARIHITGEQLSAMVQSSYDIIERTPEEHDRPQSYGVLAHKVRTAVNGVFDAESNCADHYNYQLAKFRELLMDVHTENVVLERERPQNPGQPSRTETQQPADPELPELWRLYTQLKTDLGDDPDKLQRLNQRPFFQKALRMENELIEVSRLTPSTRGQHQERCVSHRRSRSGRLSRSKSSARARSQKRQMHEEGELGRLKADMSEYKHQFEKLKRQLTGEEATMNQLQQQHQENSLRLRRLRDQNHALMTTQQQDAQSVSRTVDNTVELSKVAGQQASTNRQLVRSRRRHALIKDKLRDVAQSMKRLQHKSIHRLKYFMKDPDLEVQDMVLENFDRTLLRLGQCSWPEVPFWEKNVIDDNLLQNKLTEQAFGHTETMGAGIGWGLLSRNYHFHTSLSRNAFARTYNDKMQIVGFFIRYDAHGDELWSHKTKGSGGRYTYFLNYLVRSKIGDDWSVCEIGYAGNIKYSKKQWIAEGILPAKLKQESRFSAQSTQFILGSVAPTFHTALQFCHRILNTKRGDQNSFYLNPKSTPLDGRSTIAAQNSRTHRAVRHLSPNWQTQTHHGSHAVPS